jgi:putative copper export protein
MYDAVRLLHLLAAAVWTGGLVVLGGAVMALRRSGAERSHLQAVARAYSVVAWSAMGLAVVTGIWQLLRIGAAASNPATDFGQALLVKLLAVGTAAALTLWHQMTAGDMSPRARGIIQALILVVSVGIFAAAVWLGGASL